MQRAIYAGAIALLFIVVMVGMWFFPVGRDLEADKEFLHKSPIPTVKQSH